MTILVLGATATWAMAGLLWMVQLVHYPMLRVYSEAVPVTAALDHQRRITCIVGPLMAAEGLTALVLMFERPTEMGALSAWIAAGLLAIALASTVAVQVPLHSRLGSGHDAEAARRLVVTNWVRTVAWTARAVVLAMVLAL